MPIVAEEVQVDLLMVGAGVSGIGTGIALRKAGFTDFLLLDAADEVGGTWRDHTYPGLTVDIPSLIYSFSFAPKPDWSSMWAPQAEVFDYCRSLVDAYGLRPHLRLGVRVEEAEFDAARNRWLVRCRGGQVFAARYLVNGSGYLSTPKLPKIEGLDSFGGAVVHSCEWGRAPDLTGKRVAVIGTGATAIQLAPQVARRAERLYVLQRTPIWLLPKPALRFPIWLQRAFARVPATQRAARLATSAFMDLVFFRFFTDYPQVAWLARQIERICRAHIRRQVRDPATRAALSPWFSWGCKRPSFSQDFYPIFNEEHVELVTAPISKVTSNAVITRDGVERPVDVIICATGYQPFEKAALPTFPVRNGDGVDLREWWDEHRYQAYRGFAVPGFPNFFLVFGPYSVSSPSYFSMVEVVARMIVRCLREARRRGADRVEVTAEANARDHEDVLRRKANSIWRTANCGPSGTYYVDRFGDTPGFRPTYLHREWWASRTLPVRDFSFRRVTGSRLRERSPDQRG